MINSEYWGRLKSSLDYLIEKKTLEGKRIYVLPADEYAVEVIEYLNKNNFKIEAVLDNYTGIIGQTLRGVPIKAVQDSLYPFYPERQVVLATSYNNISLIEKLDFIECWHNVTRFLLCENMLGRTQKKRLGFFRAWKDKVKRFGLINILCKSIHYHKAQTVMNKLHLSTKKVYLFPHAAIGDIFILGTYLAQNNAKFESPFTLVVVGITCKKIALNYGFEHVLSVNQQEMDILLSYKMFMGDELQTVEILHYDFLNRSIYGPIFDQKKFTFYECYEHLVFGAITTFDNKVKAVSESDVNAYCKTKKIVRGRTVVLAPYNKSIPDISPVMWETLARELHRKGYMVITNSAKADERAVFGTQAVGIPLDILHEVIEYAGFFVGIRSGLCDIVSGCNARKVVIFPQLKGARSTVLDFYGFEHFDLKYPIKEIECKRVPDVENSVYKILNYLEH